MFGDDRDAHDGGNGMETDVLAERQRPNRAWRLAVIGTITFWVLFFLLKQCNIDLWTMRIVKNPWTMNSCDWNIRAFAESPSRSWKAMTVDFACGGFGAAGIWTVVAVVKAGQEPSEKDEIIYASNIYDSRTRLEWKSDEKLHVTLPKDVSLFDLKTLHSGIEIEIEYDPGLPAND